MGIKRSVKRSVQKSAIARGKAHRSNTISSKLRLNANMEENWLLTFHTPTLHLCRNSVVQMCSWSFAEVWRNIVDLEEEGGGWHNKEAVTCFCHAHILLLSLISPKQLLFVCNYLLHVFSGNLPLMNSIHLDETSSAVILPAVLNMTFCRERLFFFTRTCAYLLSLH